MPPLCRASDSLLLLIDIQERLLSAMSADAVTTVVRNSVILLQAATLLDVSVLITEQYPKGLGSTSADLLHYSSPAIPILEKNCFSCAQAENFVAALDNRNPRQIIIAGMETHVCVLQTALDLQARGMEVFVVEDAVCSRSAANKHNALARLRAAGIIITNTESVLFEWLGNAGHKHFRTISGLIR